MHMRAGLRAWVSQYQLRWEEAPVEPNEPICQVIVSLPMPSTCIQPPAKPTKISDVFLPDVDAQRRTNARERSWIPCMGKLRMTLVLAYRSARILLRLACCCA